MIKAAGGTAIALRVDHTSENEVKALFRRILRAHKRIDIVVDSVAGEDPLMGQYGFLWQADLKTADAIFRQGLTSRIITAKHAALAMMPAKRGLIVEVTENDMIGGGGNPMAQAVKMAQKVLPLLWAAELAPHGVAVIAITPGFLRSESMLQHFGVTEDNWREAGKKDPNFLQSESPLFVGRAVAALAADPKVQDRTGMLFSSWELARDYGFTDYDGRRPDWGRHKIDFSVLPPAWIDLFRTGADLEIKWLTTLAARTKKFRADPVLTFTSKAGMTPRCSSKTSRLRTATDECRQVLAGQRRPRRHQVGRRAFEHDPPAVVARARPEVDDPVGVRHHRLVVLDHDDRLAGVDQPVQQPEQLLEVGQVQPGGRLVEHVDAAVGTHVRRELEPLPLATRQRGERLAEPQVAEPHVGHALQDRVRGRRTRLAGAEEADRVFDRQVEHLGDVEPAEPVVQHRRLEPPALAVLADRGDAGHHRRGRCRSPRRRCRSDRRPRSWR